MYLPAPFIAQNLQKFLEPIQSYEDLPFTPMKYFSGKSINIIFIYLLAPFIVQNLLKILWADPEL